jgi:hypothetical protein
MFFARQSLASSAMSITKLERTFQNSFISFIDFLNGYDLNVARRAVSAAEVEQLLNFVNAADLGACRTAL